MLKLRNLALLAVRSFEVGWRYKSSVYTCVPREDVRKTLSQPLSLQTSAHSPSLCRLVLTAPLDSLSDAHKPAVTAPLDSLCHTPCLDRPAVTAPLSHDLYPHRSTVTAPLYSLCHAPCLNKTARHCPPQLSLMLCTSKNNS